MATFRIFHVTHERNGIAMQFTKMIAAAMLVACAAGTATANEFEEPLQALAKSVTASWLTNPVVINAVRKQNEAHAGLPQDEIIALDKKWRSETGASDQPMIKSVLANELSRFLANEKEKSAGLFTEIFVMDNKGLNVGQSDVTSDYWQGDEAKWQKTYQVGASAIHLGDVEKDESTQTFQSQLSLPIVDPADNSVVGAITLGVNVEMLAQ
jgi:hypothetical protein